jgi:hypothetical protein
MKFKVLLLLALSIVLTSAGANAIRLEADCDGWLLSGSFTVPAEINYTVELWQDGEIVCSFTETLNQEPMVIFYYTGEWCMELCGDYDVYVEFNYNMGPAWKVLYYETSFTCECDEPETCTFTPGYWKNHPEAWPVTSLMVGCQEYSQAQLLNIFDYPTQGDITVILFHHLVAAKLNVLSGSDDYIMEYIEDGDDFLCDHPLLSSPFGELKDEAEYIKDHLADYNEIECEEEEEEEEMLRLEGPAAMDNSAATEETSWGSIKKKHQ